MLYSCTDMATVGVKGLNYVINKYEYVDQDQRVILLSQATTKLVRMCYVIVRLSIQKLTNRGRD